MLIDGLTLN